MQTITITDNDGNLIACDTLWVSSFDELEDVVDDLLEGLFDGGCVKLNGDLESSFGSIIDDNFDPVGTVTTEGEC